MSDRSDLLMRPVVRRVVHYDRLLDGSLTMVDVARMNEALDVHDENAARLRESSSNG